jgi:uncharacterized protein YllA (UPF0747 family)
MATDPVPGSLVSPLESWEPLHPAAVAAARDEVELPPVTAPTLPRSAALAEALAAANRAWGNEVDSELARWLAGAEVVVTGQQPGLLGGPLLTLIKAAAVAGQVRGLRSAGRDAVGFLWLGTGDDDLAEMGWGRVVAGDELLEVREPGWTRGSELGGTVPLGSACASFLQELEARLPGANSAAAIGLAASCYREGATLGDASARFLGRLLAGCGVVLVDALEVEVARAAVPVVERIMADLPACWQALEAGAQRLRARGWAVPLRISPQKLPAFRRAGVRRESVPTTKRACPAEVLAELVAHPERFLPNAWLRPLIQDAALGSGMAILGGAELAYHVQTAEVRAVAGVGRPRWVLRPHITVVTSAERRLVNRLGVRPEQVLRSNPPAAVLPGKRTRRRLEHLRATLRGEIDALAGTARHELAALGGDVEATARKLEAGIVWLDGRVTTAATKQAEVELSRWRRLRVFIRPAGAPQERHLSVLAPLLRLGLEWPGQLVANLDPTEPGMQLLFWEEGGAW